MTETTTREVSGFTIALDRSYQPVTHMWVRLTEPGRVTIGMDPLGIETSGTLAQLSLPEPGAVLTAGRPFGQLEAVKFVGPLTSPVSGTVLAVNQAVAADPGLAERDPFGQGWLIEAALSDPAELDGLLADPEQITAWYAARIEDYRLSGAIAR
ncbi:MAG TPA: glycine cleavage system protein H [Streptosporangiaceae bacterium]